MDDRAATRVVLQGVEEDGFGANGWGWDGREEIRLQRQKLTRLGRWISHDALLDTWWVQQRTKCASRPSIPCDRYDIYRQSVAETELKSLRMLQEYPSAAV